MRSSAIWLPRVTSTIPGTVGLVAAPAAGDVPLLDAVALADFPFGDSFLQADVAAGHPLIVGDSYTQQQNTVGMDDSADTQQPTSLYVADLLAPARARPRLERRHLDAPLAPAAGRGELLERALLRVEIERPHVLAVVRHLDLADARVHHEPVVRPCLWV